jgi:hypothetical protein
MSAAMTFQRRPPDPPAEPAIVGGRVPPHNLGAEAAVLAALMADAGKLTDVSAELSDGADAFYSDNHRLIFDAVSDLVGRGEPVDVVTVAHWLRERQLIQRAGGAKYLGELVDGTPAVANVGEHARIVQRMRTRRRAIAVFQRKAAEGYGEVDEHWVDVSVAEIAELTDRTAVSSWNVLDADAIFDELPPVPWVVEALEFAPGPVSMLAGYGYSKKTLAAQSLAVSVAAGVELYGRWGVRQGKVTHVDYEQGSRLTRERYQRLARGMGVSVDELRGQLESVSLPGTYLDSANAEAVFTRALEGSALCIVDSLRAAAPSIDENASDARRVLDMLARVSENTGCMCLVIHHARKPSMTDSGGSKMQIRGTGAFWDSCQSVLILGADSGGEASIVEHEKARITGRTCTTFALEVEDVERDGDARWGLRLTAEDADDLERKRGDAHLEELCKHVLDTVRRNPGLGTKALCGLARRKHSNVLMSLQILERDGAIRNLSVGRGGAKWHAHAGQNAPPSGTKPEA